MTTPETAWINKFRDFLQANPVPGPTPTPEPIPPTPTPTPTGASVKAFDMTDSADAAWFRQAYADGYRLYAYPSLSWGTDKPRSDAQQLFKYALDAGLKVGLYSRNPNWWKAAINAVGTYKNQLQFFALDIETDPGVPVTRAMVDGVKAMGVRPIIYSGYGMWPGIMGGNNTSFKDVPLWDTNAGGATSMNPKTYTPNVLQPKPVAYGGWNVAGNMRIGIQQTFETVYNNKRIDIDSWSADFLR
jgi:hypothetical protein